MLAPARGLLSEKCSGTIKQELSSYSLGSSCLLFWHEQDARASGGSGF